MRLTIKQLVHAAHQAARYLPKASAQLMRDLAERLDTTQAALCESLKIRDALAAENAGLKKPENWLQHSDAGYAAAAIADGNGASEDDVLVAGMRAIIATIQTPDTDEFLAELRAQARREGVNFAAARLAAAFNHGFIDKPTAEVYDVVKAVLGAKEELFSAPEDGLSGEYAEQALNDWAAQLRGSQV